MLIITLDPKLALILTAGVVGYAYIKHKNNN